MRRLFESLFPRSEVFPSVVYIEDYLDRLCAPLIDRVTYEQRITIREEVRSHILILAAGHEELGSSPAEALQAAMDQFGDARTIGSALSREYQRPFALNGPVPWLMLHAGLGVVICSIALIAADGVLRAMHLPHFTVPIDCFMGLVSGWIPGLRLLRRPTSPLRAAVRTGGYYLAASTGLMLFFCIVGGFRIGRDLGIILTYIPSVGILGALGGVVLSFLFQRLERFGPRAKRTLIAR
jgi:hypothetical protein